MTALLDDIARWATTVTAEQLGAGALHAARRAVIDNVAVSLAGSERLGPHASESLATATSSDATIWSSGATSAPPSAALVNRARGDALELAAGPECVAAAIAAGESADATMDDVLAAVVVAAEVDDYFRTWLLEGLERHGLHPPAFVGAVAAASAAARLMDLGPDAYAGALAAASALSPVSPYVAFSRGASGKTLYGAWSQMLGVQAAMWAASGMIGSVAAWEGPRGIGRAIEDSPGGIRLPAFQPTGAAIARVTFKAFPCSRATHSALTALDRLQPLDAAAIARIDVWTYPYAVSVSARSDGDTVIGAQTSIPHTLALKLVFGDLEPGVAFSADRLADPRVRDLASRIAIAVDPTLPASGPRLRRARIRVSSRDGRVAEAVSTAKWGPDAPATDDELLERASRLTSRSLPGRLWHAPRDAPIRSLIHAHG